jgi:hypothetical protein
MQHIHCIDIVSHTTLYHIFPDSLTKLTKTEGTFDFKLSLQFLLDPLENSTVCSSYVGKSAGKFLAFITAVFLKLGVDVRKFVIELIWYLVDFQVTFPCPIVKSAATSSWLL